jgi:O-antigen/teichoic acid export membrane protein
MGESRSKYAKRNIISGTINKILTLFLPFLIRTVIIKVLGAEYLGLSSLFSSILQVLNMAELGFSSAVVFSLYKPIAEGNNEEVCALLFYYRKVYRLVGIVILFVGSVLIPFLPLLIKGSYPESINIYLLYGIYLTNTVISYFAFAYKSVIFSAAQKQNIISNIDSILAILRYGIQIVFLLCFRNYYLYIIWNLISTIANNLAIAHLTNKLYPQYKCEGILDRSRKEELTKQIKGLAIGKFSLVARNSFDSIVLSMFCGLVDVAIYSNYFYIYSAVGGLITVVIQGMTAGVGNSVAIESKEKNYMDFIRFNAIYNWIFGFCTVCLFCLYQPFMHLWVGDGLTAERVVMVMFCVYFYISQMGQVRGMYANAAGLWWEFRHLEIAEMIANLVLNFALGYFWGMKGILLATIVTVSAFSLIGITHQTFRYYFDRSSFDYWKHSAFFIFVTIVSCVVTANVLDFISGSSNIIFFGKAIICFLISNCFFIFVFWVNKSYRSYLLSVLDNVFNKK